MSHLSAAKATEFTQKLALAKEGESFKTAQERHDRAVAAVNAGLTQLLAERHQAGEMPTAEDVAQFEAPGESPADALAREILEGMKQ